MLLMAFSTIQFTACSNDDSNEPKQEITLSENTQKQQTIYADNANAPEGISFEANGPWKATVKEISAARADNNGIEWLSLSQYEGGAGKITLNLIIKENNTGNDRKAEITIICGNSQITISVEQKATLENGNLPDGPIINKSKLIKKITCTGSRSYSSDIDMDIYEFTYDDKGRVTNISSPDRHDSSTDKTTYSFTYLDNKVSYIGHNGNEEEIGGGEIILNEKGYAVSGNFYDFNDKEIIEWNSSWTYASNGYLTQCAQDDFTIDFKWENKNLSLLEDKNSSETHYERFTYDTNIKNKANIDYNYLIIAFLSVTSENLPLASGDDWGFTGMLGYLGKRSENVVSQIQDNHDYDYDHELENIYFTYETDKDGYIIKATVKETTYTKTIKIEYTK